MGRSNHCMEKKARGKLFGRKNEKTIRQLEKLFEEKTDSILQFLKEDRKKENELLKADLKEREDEIYRFKKELRQKEEELKNMQYKYDMERMELHNILKKRELMIENLQEEKKTFMEKYGNFERGYDLFLSLSEDTTKRLTNIFRTKTVESFIAAWADWKNIESLWSFIRRGVIEDKTEDTEPLSELFKYMFCMYNRSYAEPEYELLVPVEGEKFSKAKHHILGIKTDGFIKTVRLPGYMDRQGKIIGKSLVEV